MNRWLFPRVLLLAFSVLLASCANSSPPTVESLSGDGEYQVMTYTDFPDVPEFVDATIYYPLDTRGSSGGRGSGTPAAAASSGLTGRRTARSPRPGPPRPP